MDAGVDVTVHSWSWTLSRRLTLETSEHHNIPSIKAHLNSNLPIWRVDQHIISLYDIQNGPRAHRRQSPSPKTDNRPQEHLSGLSSGRNRASWTASKCRRCWSYWRGTQLLSILIWPDLITVPAIYSWRTNSPNGRAYRSTSSTISRPSLACI